ncbi:hypothetical protein BH09BAC4_BH09BAC4_44840 [soil metagenome]
MKNLYIFFGIILVCFGILSGCKTLFDVVPSKALYSPIDLQNNKINIKNSKGYIGNVYGDIATLIFTGKDSSLSYGVVVFYDSIDASNFVRKNIKSNLGVSQNATYVTPQEKNSLQPKMTVTVAINRSLGQFQYFVPYGYSRDNLKTFVAQGYIQAKITPWTHITDLPFTKSSNTFFKIFEGSGKLSYIQYETIPYSPESKGVPITCYEYDSTGITWSKKGSILSDAPAILKHISPSSGKILYHNNRYVATVIMS